MVDGFPLPRLQNHGAKQLWGSFSKFSKIEGLSMPVIG
jgi:hypothetical protein